MIFLYNLILPIKNTILLTPLPSFSDRQITLRWRTIETLTGLFYSIFNHLSCRCFPLPSRVMRVFLGHICPIFLISFKTLSFFKKLTSFIRLKLRCRLIHALRGARGNLIPLYMRHIELLLILLGHASSHALVFIPF